MTSNARVIGTTLLAVALTHLVLYRRILGVARPDPHYPPDDQWVPLLLSGVVVLAAGGFACRGYSSRLAAVGGALIAALTTEVYFIAIDWLEVGWGREVGHDVFFGDVSYWGGTVLRVLIFGTGFAIVAGTSWRPRRGVRAHSAG